MNRLVIRIAGNVLNVHERQTRTGKTLYEIQVYDGEQLIKVLSKRNGYGQGEQFDGKVVVSSDRYGLSIWEYEG